MAGTLFILDQLLKCYGGHSFHYDSAVAGAVGDAFREVVVAGDVSFREADRHGMHRVFADANALPAVRAARLLLGRRQDGHTPGGAGWYAPGPLNQVFHDFKTRRFSRCVLRFLRDRLAAGCEARIFFPTAEPYVTAAVERFAPLLWWRNADLRFHLVLRLEPELYCAGVETPEELARRLTRMHATGAGRIRFYVDTPALSRAYAELTDDRLAFPVLPIPVALRDEDICPEKREENELRLGLMGPPRPEKGIAHLPGFVRQTPALIGNRAVTFVLQEADGIVEADTGRMLHALREEGRRPDAPRVEIAPGPVAPAAYARLFAGIDIAVLPYDVRRYRCSSSGVMVEAMRLGHPVVTFAGTWMAELVAEAAGRGLRIGAILDTSHAFAAAVAEIAGDLKRYRRDVRSFYQQWSAGNSLDRLVDLLRKP